MPGLGTIVNVLAIIAGGILGMTGGRFLTEKIQNTVITTSGICVMFLGTGSALARMLTLENGVLNTQGTMMMIGCLILGGLIGEVLGIEDRLEGFGEWLKKKTGNSGDNAFVNAFVTASLTVCVGAMAVVGSLQDGIYANHAVLYAKSVLDFVIIVIMTASMGKGAIFSAVSVGVFQGTVTLLSTLIAPVLTKQALSNLSYVGNIMIFCVGLNLVFGKKVRVASLLPGLVLAVAWAAF